MGNLFNLDNKFFRVMGKIWDMFVISLMWTICCLPLYFVIMVITSPLNNLTTMLLDALVNAVLMIPVGPAMCAIYYVSVKVIRRDRGYVTREFLHGFKINFKMGASASAIFGFLATILSFNVQFCYVAAVKEGNQGDIMLGVTFAVIILLFCVAVILFPVLSRFSFRLGQLFKTSVFIAFRHFPSTIVIMAIVLASGYALLILQPAIFIVPALCALLVSFPMEVILKKYMPKPEETVVADGDRIQEGDVVTTTQEGEKKDLWYLE